MNKNETGNELQHPPLVKNSVFKFYCYLYAGMLVVPLPVDILATDYNNYAMLYSCSPALGLDGYISGIGQSDEKTPGSRMTYSKALSQTSCW